MMQLGSTLLKAIRKKIEGEIAVHKVNVQVLLENHVGVAEHPDITTTIEDELAIIATCEDKLAVIKQHFPLEISTP
jgi:ribosomal protein L10